MPGRCIGRPHLLAEDLTTAQMNPLASRARWGGWPRCERLSDRQPGERTLAAHHHATQLAWPTHQCSTLQLRGTRASTPAGATPMPRRIRRQAQRPRRAAWAKRRFSATTAAPWSLQGILNPTGASPPLHLAHDGGAPRWSSPPGRAVASHPERRLSVSAGVRTARAAPGGATRPAASVPLRAGGLASTRPAALNAGRVSAALPPRCARVTPHPLLFRPRCSTRAVETNRFEKDELASVR